MICDNNESKMFVTVWLAILDLKSGKLTAANVGHEYPIIKTPGKGFELYKDKHCFMFHILTPFAGLHLYRRTH